MEGDTIMRRGRYNGTDEQSRENATKALLDMLMWQGIVSDSQSAAQNASMRERFGMRSGGCAGGWQ